MSDHKLTEVVRNRLADLAERNLWDDNGASNEALRYLRDKRGLDDKTIKEFHFGFVPLHARDKIPGLGHIFAGRIIMPVIDPYGKLVILTAGRFREGDNFVKYWHESFDKSWYLYGMDVAKKSIVTNNKAIVVEGQMDVARMHQFGFNISVGILGSAFEESHLCMLASRCNEIFLLFDNDNSGRGNLDRAMKLYRDRGWGNLGIRFIPVRLPEEDQDPDDFLKVNGREAMLDLLKKAKTLAEEEDLWQTSHSQMKLSI